MKISASIFSFTTLLFVLAGCGDPGIRNPIDIPEESRLKIKIHLLNVEDGYVDILVKNDSFWNISSLNILIGNRETKETITVRYSYNREIVENGKTRIIYGSATAMDQTRIRVKAEGIERGGRNQSSYYLYLLHAEGYRAD